MFVCRQQCLNNKDCPFVTEGKYIKVCFLFAVIRIQDAVIIMTEDDKQRTNLAKVEQFLQP